MWVLITYDIATDTPEGRSRLRRVAKTCQDYGQRVQKSVFECILTEKVYEVMKQRLLKEMNENEDSIRFYRLPEGRERRVEEFGQGQVLDFRGPLIV